MEVVETKDGSPSLVFFKDGHSQMMHSNQGAFSETEYIYGTAIDLAFKNFQNIHALSIGLGFSYVELAVFCRAILVNRSDIYLDSYEKEPLLIEALLGFLNKKPDSPFYSSYEKIFSIHADFFKIEIEQIRSFLLQMLDEKQWLLHGSYELKCEGKYKEKYEEKLEKKYNLILFDPFCSKFSPEFWKDDYLDDFISQTCDHKCVLSSYAATGILNRSLQKHGFAKMKREGFGKKRGATLAYKGF